MNRRTFARRAAAAACLAACWLSACRTAPFTQRKQLLLLPEDQELMLGEASYRELLEQAPLSRNLHYVELVNRVGERIAEAADRADYQWEFQVVASPEQNAFCLPGGKVVVYEGILPICQDEAGLAVVLSHEIAHALARHGGERMSQQLLAQGVSLLLDRMTEQQERYNRELIKQAYGAVSELGVLLPFSRKHESEADRIGLILMAKAGYDPTAAPEFWRRFAAAGGPEPAEFFSTHPADERRAADLAKLLPEALALYNASPVKYGRGEPIRLAGSPPATRAARSSAPATAGAPGGSAAASGPPRR